MRKQFEELHPLFDLEKDEQGEYTCVLTRVTWLGFELGKKTLQAEIDQLNSVLDERTKEWLQAIECGTYFENVAKPLKTEIDQLKAELALCREENKGLVESLNGEKALTTEALSQMRQKALILSEDCDGYKDPVQICQSEGVGWCVRFLETALQGGDQNTKNKAQSIENTGHEGGDQKALRGAND